MAKKYRTKQYEFVRSSGGIREYRLKANHLTVLLMEERSAPLVTFMVTYHVGSRNEAVGHTGSTHLLEHLMFKGSKNYNKETGRSIWTVLQSVGAQVNASTWLDRTDYFELLPSEYLAEAIKIEADRMRNAFLRDEDRQPEMTVVRNEFERGENEPFEVLDKAIWATAYQAHPYHHPTIGWRSDIENISTERLREFYDTFYWPNNATATVIGDFQEEEALAMIGEHFGSIPPSPHQIPEMYTTEPKQEGWRRIVVRRAGPAPIVGVGHKSPMGLHEDTYALQILSRILGSGKTSRFYKTIVDRGLATEISVWDHPFHDNGLFITYAFLTPDTEPAEVETIIVQEYEAIKEKGVTEEEVARARAKVRAETAFSRDGSFSIASNLNEAIAIGDWTFYTTFLDSIAAVSARDVQQVARTYLNEDQCTIGYFLPRSGAGNGSAHSEPRAVHQAAFRRHDSSDVESGANVPAVRSAASKLGRSSLAGRIEDEQVLAGVRLLSMKTDIEDVVTIQGSILGGRIYSPVENCTIAEVTAAMLDEGTIHRDKFAISEALEEVGASLSFTSTNYRVRFGARCLTKDIPLVIELLTEQLRDPAFKQDDLDMVKTRRVGELKRSKEETRVRAMEAFLQELYPEDHPNFYVPLDHQIADLQKVTTEDIRRFHQENYGTGNLIIVAIGDVNRDTLARAVKKGFGGWRESRLLISVKHSKARERKGEHRGVITLDDKTSVDIVLGEPIGIDEHHDDYHALAVGHYVLGGNFSARLMSTVRDQEGLTYGIRSAIAGVDNGNDGYWYIWGTFAPALVQAGRESTLRQLDNWIRDGVTEDELTAKKTTIIGSYKVSLGTTTGLASQLLRIVEQNRDISYLDEYPQIINEISLDQVNTVIRKYCHGDRCTTFAAGSIGENWQPLEE